MPTLPPDLLALIAPLQEVLPMDRALTRAVVSEPLTGEPVDAVRALVNLPQIDAKGPLAAGLWLYVDDLNSSHVISQAHEGKPTFDYWHCIMHRLEGDFSNSHYWRRRTGQHPAMATVGGGYDADRLIDAAEAAERAGKASEQFIASQRAEWIALMTWCWTHRGA